MFVLAERGAIGRGLVEVDQSGRWRAEEDLRTWATPSAANVNEGESPESWEARRQANLTKHGNGNGQGEPLAMQVRPWAAPTASDVKTGWTQDNPDRAERRNLLGDQCGGKRLNPAWTEQLMGLPRGWTSTTGPQQEIDWRPQWPRGRYPADWDRSIPWPQYAHEAPRTLPDGEPARGRPARIRLCGNGVVPQQGTLALDALLGRGVQQLRLFA